MTATAPAIDRRVEFEQIVEKKMNKLREQARYHSPRGMDEDVLGSTLMKAWRSLTSFRGEAAMYSWIISIMKNEARMASRNIKDFQEVRANDAIVSEAQTEQPVLLRELIGSLPVREARELKSFLVDGHTMQSDGKSTRRVRYRRAVQMVRERNGIA